MNVTAINHNGLTSPINTDALPQQVGASIANSALLVTLSRSVPTFIRLDKRVSNKVTNNENAFRGAAKVNKSLIQCEPHDALKTLSSEVYNYHIRNTVAWNEAGARLLPNEKLIDYKNTMGAYALQFEAAKRRFLTYYPAAVSTSQLRLGDMFNEGDYPPVDELSSRIGVRVNYEPIPDAGDFRVDIGNQAAKELQDTYNNLLQERLKGAMDSVWERLLQPLENMSKMLDYTFTDKPTGFRDTLVDNVTQIVDLMRVCNITKDPKMEQIRIGLTQALRGVTPEGLREDSLLREATKKRVDQIIKDLPSLGF